MNYADVYGVVLVTSTMQRLTGENRRLKHYCIILLALLAAMSVKYWGWL